MITFLLLLGAVSVYGQGGHGHDHGHNHSCIHNNHQQKTAKQVIVSVIIDLDENGDGDLEAKEVLAQFAANYDKDGSGDVSEDEFVHQWHHTYHDTHPFAGYLFHNFDMDNDNKLTDKDVTAMEQALDTNGDGKLSIAEFETAMTRLYTDCVTTKG
ncbi:uncharacterized protein [Haliotis asinina]|uniref:uncharacterized protein n=1 Tax=Haliotis asinina TaxID=109174 RepID=UPI0035324F58